MHGTMRKIAVFILPAVNWQFLKYLEDLKNPCSYTVTMDFNFFLQVWFNVLT